jgi:hypothetical protein
VIKKEGLEAFRTEWCIFCPKLFYSGSIDALFRKKKEDSEEYEYYIYDWKRTRALKKENPFQRCKHPVEHLPDASYWRYSLQLNMYRYILEQVYGMHIAGMYLVVVHPENESYLRTRVPKLNQEIAEIVEIRRNKLKCSNSTQGENC